MISGQYCLSRSCDSNIHTLCLSSFCPSKGELDSLETWSLAWSWSLRHQGNIEFVETEENGPQKGGLEVADEALVGYVAKLTATPRDLVLRTLLARTVASGGREVIEKSHTVAEASYARDACAKVFSE